MATTLYISVKSLDWAYTFANTNPQNSAATIAAILGPVGLMQTAMLNFYTNARK